MATSKLVLWMNVVALCVAVVLYHTTLVGSYLLQPQHQRTIPRLVRQEKLQQEQRQQRMRRGLSFLFSSNQPHQLVSGLTAATPTSATTRLYSSASGNEDHGDTNIDSNRNQGDEAVLDCVTGPMETQMQLLLEKYWGRQPLLLKKAYPDPLHMMETGKWPTCDDIVTLATRGGGDCDDDQEDEDEPGYYVPSGKSARFIQHIPGELDSYTLELGPFSKSNLLDTMNQNNNKAWTVLVNDVDRFMTAVCDWMDDEYSSLVPRWRRDDAQVSLASSTSAAKAGGGIGCHVDNYDVLLIQTSGQRHWSVSQQPITQQQEDQMLVPNLDVRILNLKEWAGTPLSFYQDVVLEPGDVLYLPPRFVHSGTAVVVPATPDNNQQQQNQCMTLSVGFRAPSSTELAAAVAESLQEGTIVPEEFYKDNHETLLTSFLHEKQQQSSMEEQIYPPSLSDDTKSSMKELLLNSVTALINNQEAWDELVGRVVTTPKRYTDDEGDVLTEPTFDDTDNDDEEVHDGLGLDDDNEYDDDYDDNVIEDQNSSSDDDEEPVDDGSTIGTPKQVLLYLMQQETIAEESSDNQNERPTRIVLRRSEGVITATSQLPKDGTTTIRFFANGEMWQIVAAEGKDDDDDDGYGARVPIRVFGLLERGQVVQSKDLVNAPAELLAVLEDLLEKDIIYYHAAVEDEED